MIGILSRRIRTICEKDLKWFREQVFAGADQDALAEGVDGVGVPTSMQQKPSVITRGLSVEVIGFKRADLEKTSGRRQNSTRLSRASARLGRIPGGFGSVGANLIAKGLASTPGHRVIAFTFPGMSASIKP